MLINNHKYTIIHWCVARKQLFCKLWFCVGLSGLQMCCFERWLFINPFLFFVFLQQNNRCSCFFSLVPNSLIYRIAMQSKIAALCSRPR